MSNPCQISSYSVSSIMYSNSEFKMTTSRTNGRKRGIYHDITNHTNGRGILTTDRREKDEQRKCS